MKEAGMRGWLERGTGSNSSGGSAGWGLVEPNPQSSSVVSRRLFILLWGSDRFPCSFSKTLDADIVNNFVGHKARLRVGVGVVRFRPRTIEVADSLAGLEDEPRRRAIAVA